MRKVLIAHSSEDVRITLENIISCKYETFICCNCVQALELIENEEPDALILDLSLHGGSASDLLKSAAKFLPPIILATTWFPEVTYIREMTNLGVDYIVALPAKLGKLVYRLEDMILLLEQQTPKTLKTLLHHLQIPTHLDGYTQLLSVVPMYMEDPKRTLSKEIYPAIVAQMGLSSWKCVDRSIRSAIEQGWNTCGNTIWRQYFPNHTKAPKISQFLAFVSDYLTEDTTKE